MENSNFRCQNSTTPQDDVVDYVKAKLQSLQDAQTRLTSSVERLILVQNDILAAQKELAQAMTAHLQNIHIPHAEPSNHDECSGPRLDAGRRLSNTSELLELCLLNLSNEDILFAQRVNKQFCSVIEKSSHLQRKLFFVPDPTAGMDFRTTLNPMFSNENIRLALPLFFDHREKRLAFCYRDGRTRLYCQSITATTMWIYMTLSSQMPALSRDLIFEDREHQTRLLGKGSWKRMYVSQPTCSVSWCAHVTCPAEQRSKSIYHVPPEIQKTYRGTVADKETMNTLLDGLAESLVTEGG